MRRREFFRKSVGAGIAAGAAFSLGGYNKLWASSASPAKYDMIALMAVNLLPNVRPGNSGTRRDATFVQKGQKVL
jgi:hypothetical protein